MKKKEVTARSFVRLPDGTVLPVSTIHNVGSDEYSAHRFT